MSWKFDVIRGLHNFEEITGAGALGIIYAVSFVNTALDHGLVDADEGQLKIIVHNGTSECTVTPTSLRDYTTITFPASDEGHWIALRFTRHDWEILDYSSGVTLS